MRRIIKRVVDDDTDAHQQCRGDGPGCQLCVTDGAAGFARSRTRQVTVIFREPQTESVKSIMDVFERLLA